MYCPATFADPLVGSSVALADQEAENKERGEPVSVGELVRST